MVEQNDSRDETPKLRATRSDWVKPTLQRISAGSAESDLTNVVPDGIDMSQGERAYRHQRLKRRASMRRVVVAPER